MHLLASLSATVVLAIIVEVASFVATMELVKLDVADCDMPPVS